MILTIRRATYLALQVVLPAPVAAAVAAAVAGVGAAAAVVAVVVVAEVVAVRARTILKESEVCRFGEWTSHTLTYGSPTNRLVISPRWGQGFRYRWPLNNG